MSKKAVFFVMIFCFLLIGLNATIQEKYSKRFDTGKTKAELADRGYEPFLWKLKRILSGEKSGLAPNEPNKQYIPFICYYSWYDPKSDNDIFKLGTVSIRSPYYSGDINLAKEHVREIENYMGPQAVVSFIWDGPGKKIEQLFFKGFLAAKEQLKSPLRFFILYELAWYANRGYIYNENGQIDFADSTNQKIFWKDMLYFSEKFFSRDDYFKIDGKPAIFFWTNTVKNLMYARHIASYVVPSDIFLILGENLFTPPDFNSGGKSELEERMLALSVGGGGAVTSYVSYNPDEVKKHGSLNDGYIEDMVLAELKWIDYLKNNAPLVKFIPPVTFTYDDTHIKDRQDASGKPLNPPMFSDEKSRNLLMRATLLLINEFNLPDIVRICSYNELGEGTALEWSVNYGNALLKVVQYYLNRR